MLIGVFFIVLSLVGICSVIKNMKKYDIEEKNHKKKLIKFICLPLFIFLLLAGIGIAISPSKAPTSSSPTTASQSTNIEEQRKVFKEWGKKLNEPVKKMTDLTPFFDKITAGLENKQLSRAEAQVLMDQLSNHLSDVSSEFRTLRLPDEKLFTKEQNESFKFVRTNLQDAANNYSKAADHLSKFIETAHSNRIMDMKNYINNANAHTSKSTERLNELIKEIGIESSSQDDSDGITINLK